MTDQQINQRIAEACGWTEILSPTSPPEFRRRPTGVLGNLDRKQIPNYCADLNAMHEAEKVFDAMSSKMFGGWLMSVCIGKNASWHTTARQRAEAFLRTLGKWEEVQG